MGALFEARILIGRYIRYSVTKGRCSGGKETMTTRQPDVGDAALVRMQQKRAELIKKRDRLNQRISHLDLCIARHPEDVRQYLAKQGTWLGQFMLDPRR
jgi:hypothetical protein